MPLESITLPNSLKILKEILKSSDYRSIEITTISLFANNFGSQHYDTRLSLKNAIVRYLNNDTSFNNSNIEELSDLFVSLFLKIGIVRRSNILKEKNVW